MTDNPIIVYSAQKCGSTTVMRALESAGYQAHRAYAENIHTLPWRESKIITLVRDPIEQGISLMFEKWLMKQRRCPLSMTFPITTMEHFPNVFWFDEHFEPLFGENPLDVESARGTPFRYYIHEELLIMRTEDLSEHLERNLRVLVGEKEAEFDVQHRARGTDRFGRAYHEYCEKARIDPLLLDMIYQSDYCKAFWTKEEREEKKKRWLK